MENDLTLEAMSDARFAEYREVLIPLYAEEGARATGVSAEEALATAKRQIGAILPDGARTEGQHLRDLVDGTGARVGVLWYASQLDREPPRVFLYEIRIDESRRCRGLGGAAMRLLEEEARALGAEEVALHVFSHNEPAIRLYRRLGYRVLREGEGGIQMAKGVGG